MYFGSSDTDIVLAMTSVFTVSFICTVYSHLGNAVVHIPTLEADIECSLMALALITSLVDLPTVCVVYSGVSKTQCDIITSTYV